MLPTPFLPAAVADRRPTALGVLGAVLLPPLVRAARSVVHPAATPSAPIRGSRFPAHGTAPRCLR